MIIISIAVKNLGLDSAAGGWWKIYHVHLCLVVASWGLGMHQLGVSVLTGGLSDWGRNVGEQDWYEGKRSKSLDFRKMGGSLNRGAGWGC